MHFLHVVEEDGRYVASLREAATPEPRADEVLIRVRGSGVNRADLAQIAGRYPPPAGASEILGLEVSGTNTATGEAVCALVAGGGHAEYVAAPVGQVFPAPGTVDLVTAAGIPEAFVTAFVTVVMEGELRGGETLLVHAGASGVGLAAIQVGKHFGARVAATTRTPEKLAALEAAGADLAIDAARQDVATEIEARWGRNAVAVVLDPVGATSLATDLRVLTTGGRIVLISTLSGARVETDLGLVMGKRARLIGSMLRSRSRAEKAALVSRVRAELLPGFAAGTLRVTVDRVFAPSQAAEAFQRMHDNHNVGKILFAWPGD
jgi:putative PIG3 family NAD(P)H quinone oxidoreductase